MRAVDQRVENTRGWRTLNDKEGTNARVDQCEDSLRQKETGVEMKEKSQREKGVSDEAEGDVAERRAMVRTDTTTCPS